MFAFLKRNRVEKVIKPINQIVFNVDNFNIWFNYPNNGSIYCNSGIFLRMDKLSIDMIEEYLATQYNIVEFDSKLYEFKKEILDDWKIKLNNSKK